MVPRLPIVWRMPAGYAGLLIALLLVDVGIAATGANLPLFIAFQKASHIVPTTLHSSFWQSATYAGDTLAALALATVLLARRPDLAWAGILAAVPGSIFTHGLKALFPVLRPASVLAEHSFEILGPVLKLGSLPSGHSVTAGILAGVVYLGVQRVALRVAVLVLALLIGWSRIAVGVHWPFDVVTGLFGGLLSAWIGVCLVQHQPWTATLPARVVASLVFGGCSLALAFHAAGLPGATPFRYTLASTGFALSAFALHVAIADWRAGRGVDAATSV